MLVVSYNVASWTTTLREIISQFGSLTRWLDLLQIDILCLQETKITKEKLTQSPDQYGAMPDGWDSFWCCCRTIKKGAQGFNGVATYARKGLTTRAESQVFGQPHLDLQGRTLLTQHGDMAIFNVYAPTGSHATKKEFHQQLTLKMREQRAKGMRVVLAGDLNVTRRKEDVVWHSRMLTLQLLMNILHARVDQKGHTEASNRGHVLSDRGLNDEEISDEEIRGGGLLGTELRDDVNTSSEKIGDEKISRTDKSIEAAKNSLNALTAPSTRINGEGPHGSPRRVTDDGHITRECSMPKISSMRIKSPEETRLCGNNTCQISMCGNNTCQISMCGINTCQISMCGNKPYETSGCGEKARDGSDGLSVALEEHTARKILAALPQTIELLKGLRVLEVPGSKKPKEYTRKTTSYKVESACGKKWLGKRFDSLARAAGSFMVGEWDDVEVALVPNSLQTTLSTRAPNHTQRHLAQTQTPAETDTEIHADRDGDRDGDARTNDWESVPDGARGLDGTDGWTAGGRIQPHPHTHPHTHTPNTGSCDIETCRHELTVKQWSECLEKGGGLVLTEREQYSLAAFGSSYSSLFNQKWLNGLISEDDMVDSFTAFHPDARERFTCFEQYTNRRYFNEGARIDFIMVDRPLFQQCASIGHALQGRPGPEVEDKVQGRISPEVNVQVYPQIKSSEETIQKTCNGESNLATAAQRSIQDQPTRSTTDNPNQESTEHSHTTDTTNTGPGQELAVTRLEAQSIAVGTPGPIAPTVPSFKVPGQADAMHCVTAGGLFVPAPFDGSGMMEAPRKAYEFHIIAPHTGMIYTPPKFSDHLPVCLLLQDRDGARCCSRTCACACACAKTDVSSQPLRDAQAREKESAAHATTETLCTRARPCTSPCMCPRACACACARAYVCRRSSTTTTQWSQWKLPRNITLDKNHAGTRRTQPFAAQKKLTAFFSATTAATATATAAGAGNDPPAAETGQSSPAVPAPVDLAEGPTGAVQEDRDGDVNNTHVREQSRTVGELGATTSVNTFGTVVVGDAGGTSVGISSSGDTGKAMPHRDATVTVGSTATHSTGNVGVEVVGADSAGTDKVGRRKPAISSRDEAAIFAARMMDKSLLASERRGQVKRRQAQQKQGTITKRDKSTKQMVGMGIGRNGGSIGNGSDAINRTGGDGIGLGAINRTRGGGGDGVRAVEPAQRKAKAQRRKQAGKKSGGVQASILGFFGS